MIDMSKALENTVAETEYILLMKPEYVLEGSETHFVNKISGFEEK
jgi:hypothetical protein